MEGVQLAPYVAIQGRLNRRYAWMDCKNCLANSPEQSRAALRCGYMASDQWVGDGRAAYVPGSPVQPPSICPGYSIAHRKVVEVADAWGWWKRGQLQLRYPNPTDVLADLIGMFNESISGAESYMIEQSKK